MSHKKSQKRNRHRTASTNGPASSADASHSLAVAVQKAQSSRVGAMFWLLNEWTMDEKATTQIVAWSDQLTALHPLSKKERRAQDGSVGERWACVFEVFEGTSKPASVRSVLLKLASTFCLPQIAKLEGRKHLVPIIEPSVADLSRFRIGEAAPGLGKWFEQILAVEVPLRVAHDFPELVVDADWVDPAIDWMSDMITQHLDTDGWPSAELLPVFGPLVASWSRSFSLIEKSGWRLRKKTLKVLRGAVQHLFRLLRPDGQLMLGGFGAIPISKPCIRSMQSIVDGSFMKQITNQISSEPTKPRGSMSRAKLDCSEPESTVSEWGESGILTAGRNLRGGKIGFEFADESCIYEIVGQLPLVSGTVFPQITFNGEAVQPLDSFDLISQELDDHQNYIELQMNLSHGLTLNRQLMLVHPDQVFYSADCIVSPEPGKIGYRCDWPLAPGVGVLEEIETRELYVQTDSIQSLVLPLSLPEWLVGPSAGKLEYDASSRSLCLTDQVEGMGIYVPLVFDLSPKRSRKKRTWRPLTVVESRRAVPRDVAAAFRFQLGYEQWFAYRAVSSKGLRSFLGQHFKGEFLFSRFGQDGTVDEYLRLD